MKKNIVGTVLFAVLLIFCACTLQGNPPADVTEVTVKMEFVTKSGDTHSFETSTSKQNVLDVMADVCKQNDVPYAIEKGMFDGFYDEFSDTKDGWLLYVNGSLAEVGPAEIAPSQDDVYSFRFVNYDAAFAG